MKTELKNSTIIKTRLAQPRAEKNKYYVDNEKLCKDVEEYVKLAKKADKDGVPRPKVPESIGSALYLIAERLSTINQFVGYTYRDEMVADAVFTCIKYIANFDTTKSKNAFAYFTQIVYYSFMRTIQFERKHAYIKYKTIFNAMTDNSNIAQDDASDPDLPANMLGDLDMNLEHLSDYCAKYEDKNNLKGKKPKKTKAHKFKPATIDLEKFIKEA